MTTQDTRQKELPNGIPKKEDYLHLVTSEDFTELEAFSNKFLERTANCLEDYNNKWVKDPLHQWSRQWEYPFVVWELERIITSTKSKQRVLDVGSGITFVPFYLHSQFSDKVEVVCADSDTTLPHQFNQVVEEYGADVSMNIEDMRGLSYSDQSFDIVYSVSVLEHTDNYPVVVENIARVLRPGGSLVLTFDISIDGNDDIPVERVEQLFDALSIYFDTTGLPSVSELQEKLSTDTIISSDYIATLDKSLMPWKYPVVNVIRPMLQLRSPGRLYKRLTVYCVTLTKKNME